jgi:hypothetical protein
MNGIVQRDNGAQYVVRVFPGVKNGPGAITAHVLPGQRSDITIRSGSQAREMTTSYSRFTRSD